MIWMHEMSTDQIDLINVARVSVSYGNVTWLFWRMEGLSSD